uniref:Nucleotid_trans domain-containing protein n=1 Tax=Strongyloides stercoralis TaxID=6248 RepID=A0A0K0EGB6_STRER
MVKFILLHINIIFFFLYCNVISKKKLISNNLDVNPSNVSFLIEEPFTLKRKPTLNHKIHIVTIVQDKNISDYAFALDTVFCYVLQYKYNYKLININEENEYSKNCKQEDFMFQRHCILSNYMIAKTNHSDIILFLDADMAIINPNQLIEDYMQNGKEEILFYERMYNHEIMAGSYFIKNNRYGHKFLKNWANYYFKKPKSFDGSDNVALHNVLIDMFIKEDVAEKYNNCKKLWKTSKNFNDIRIYVACLRVILNNNSEKITDDKNLNSYESEIYSYDKERVKVIKKLSKRKWARDIWLENSKWSSQDFFLHDVKLKNLNSNTLRTWNSPWKILNFNITICKNNTYYENWTYNNELIKKRKFMKLQLREYYFNVDNKFKKDINQGIKLLSLKKSIRNA